MVIKIKRIDRRLFITTPFDESAFIVSKKNNPFILEKTEVRFNLFLMLLYDYTDGHSDCIEQLWKYNSIKEFNKIWYETW